MLALHESEAALSPRVSLEAPAMAGPSTQSRLANGALSVAVHEDIAALEDLWRGFETVADCTVFQTFAWHAAWQNHIGRPSGVKPAIVVGREQGRILFILPFAVEKNRLINRLVWHASDLCDYNAPLLAPDFTQVIGDGNFPALFGEIVGLIDARTPFDAVYLGKMPEAVGGQSNPLLSLATTLNPSGAYLMRLGAAWDAVYNEKRSSATRRRDRTKRKRLADLGELKFVTPDSAGEIVTNLEALFDQKGKAFAEMGVPNFLAAPGVQEFFIDLATAPETRGLVHVSRFDVGPILAAANLGLVFRGRYYHVLASYDCGPAAKFGPGAAHLHELMAYAIGRGCDTFDFTIGDERYKREWSDTRLDLHDHRCATTVRGYLAALPGAVLTQVKRTIKQNPVLWNMATKVREKLFGRERTAAKPEETTEEA